jgi:hypothetical protein
MSKKQFIEMVKTELPTYDLCNLFRKDFPVSLLNEIAVLAFINKIPESVSPGFILKCKELLKQLLETGKIEFNEE